MLTTVTLWTLMIWAEPLNSRASLTASTIPGFATEKSCQAARDRLIMENAAQPGGRGVGQPASTSSSSPAFLWSMKRKLSEVLWLTNSNYLLY